MKRGFTLIEVLVCVGIVAIVAALVYPTFAEARRSARISSALAHLRQIHLAFKLYQENNGGDGGYGGPAEMNLPDVEQLTNTYIGHPESFWISPCAVDDPRFRDFTYMYFIGDNPRSIERARTQQEETILIADGSCDPKKFVTWGKYIRTRGLGVRLGGRLVNRYAYGDPNWAEWWDP